MNIPLPLLDLYGLRLVHLVAGCKSITAAAKAAGLTQSAMTRQIQNIEQRLGTVLFNRSTRRLEVTPAGETLLRETAAIPLMMEAALRQVRENHLGVPRQLRLGVSRSVALAHLPGLLNQWLRQNSSATLEVSHLHSTELMEAVIQQKLDAAILGAPRQLPADCRIVRRMTDAFVLIAPESLPAPASDLRWNPTLRSHLSSQTWLMLTPQTQTCQDTWTWLRKCAITPERAAAFDSFDLIIHLVALGLGIALVPRRALAVFPRRRKLRIWPLPESFERELVVVVRRHGAIPAHLQEFLGTILFS